jgi:class 3 adenylate cyclase/tetratricopeptide (TPR) repeat protein
MRCQKCSAENPPGAQFCIQCAARLQRRCPQCGFENPREARFCAQCAVALASDDPVADALPTSVQFLPPTKGSSGGGRPEAGGSQPDRAPIGERRYLTVLFCDLVNSTSIATRLDPEDWRDIVANYHRAAAQAIERFGGYVAQYLGDGVMAFFGYPEAQGNDAERAARAGLAILEAMSQLDARPVGTELAARVGIHSGAVVVGVGVDKRNGIFGDTPNIAARVQAAAEPETLLISAGTHRLISGSFDVEDCGLQIFKGLDRPLRCYKVLRPRGARGRLATERRLTPFIGREGELRLLLSRWERVRQGDGQVVIVMGEPGIGKSRLVGHFRHQIIDQHHLWIESAADQFAQTTPFYAVAQMLRQGVGSNENSHGEKLINQLRVSLERAGVDVQHALPLVAPLLNSSPPKDYPAPPAAPEERRRRLLASLANWAMGLAKIQPMALVLEDLQWADASTVELAKLLADHSTSAPLMLIYTARAGFTLPWPIMPNHTQLSLDRLPDIQTREIVVGVAKASGLPSEVIDAVVQRSSGVPLFVEELTRDLLEHGDYQAHEQIPVTLHDSLMARLDRLGRARELTQIGAAIGREFPHELLRIVASVSEDELQGTLERLIEADLIHLHPDGPDKRYIFKHALVRDAAYGTLLKSRRRELHRRIAGVLEERFPETVASAPELLGHHYTEAGLAEQAVRYWQRAGEKAIEQSANLEAIVHLRKGLELLNTLPTTSEHIMQEIRLQMALTTPLIAIKGYTAAEVENACNRALKLCQEVGDVPELFVVLGGLNSIYYMRSELEIALELAGRMLRLAESRRDPVLTLWAHYAFGFNLAAHGRLKAARHHLERSIALYEPRRGGTYGFVQDPGPTAMAMLAHRICQLGYPDQASERMRQAITLARNLSHPYTLVRVLGGAAALDWKRGDKSTARELWEEQATLCASQGFKSQLASASLNLGFAMVEEGRGKDGIAKMQDALGGSLQATSLRESVNDVALMALALGKIGETEQGLEKIDKAIALAEQAKRFGDDFVLYLFKGQLLLIKDAAGLRKAKQCFSAAITIARGQHAKSDELTVAIQLAKIMMQQGRRKQARAMLSKIYNWFTEGFDTADLKEAKALLEQLHS